MGKIYKNGIEYGGGGGSAGHTILDNDGNTMPAEDNLQFKGLGVTDNSTDGVTEVESIGLNQDSLDDVTDGSIGNEIINNGMTYSTNEQIVGKWIDGKPLYQKTVDLGAISANTWNDGTILIPDVDMIMKVDFVAIQNSGRYVSEYYRTSNDMLTQWILKLPSDTYPMELCLTTTALTHRYVTIRYTKTTD